MKNMETTPGPKGYLGVLTNKVSQLTDELNVAKQQLAEMSDAFQRLYEQLGINELGERPKSPSRKRSRSPSVEKDESPVQSPERETTRPRRARTPSRSPPSRSPPPRSPSPRVQRHRSPPAPTRRRAIPTVNRVHITRYDGNRWSREELNTFGAEYGKVVEAFLPRDGVGPWARITFADERGYTNCMNDSDRLQKTARQIRIQKYVENPRR